MAIHKTLARVIPHQGLVLVAGGIGSGKSCMAYEVIEDLHNREPARAVYAFNFPAQKEHLLPEWIETTNDENFREGSVVLADEAYFSFYAKDHANDLNKFMDKFSGLVRQKGILVIFITQTTRKLTLATVSGVQTFLVKKPDIMMVKLDRAELRPIFREALKNYMALPAEDRVKALWVVSEEFEGLLPEANGQPSFWSEELSRAWQGVELKPAAGPPEESGDNSIGDPLAVFRAVNQLIVDSYAEGDFYDALHTVSDVLQDAAYSHADLDDEALARAVAGLRLAASFAGEWESRVARLSSALDTGRAAVVKT